MATIIAGAVKFLHSRLISLEAKMDASGLRLAADQDNVARDLWQAFDADRRANQVFREQMLREGATRSDVAALKHDIERMFEGLDRRLNKGGSD